jgi:hypothetical protein
MYFSLENISSQKSGLLDTKRGDFLPLVIATGPLLVVKSGGNTMGKKWEIVVRGLCGLQSPTDILTKSSFLTYLFINNSPL